MSKSLLHYSDRRVNGVDKRALIPETGLTVYESVFFSSERSLMQIHPLTEWEVRCWVAAASIRQPLSCCHKPNIPPAASFIRLPAKKMSPACFGFCCGETCSPEGS